MESNAFQALEDYHLQRDKATAAREGIPLEFVQMNRSFAGMLNRRAYERAAQVVELLQKDPERIAGRPACGDIVEAYGPEKVYRHAHLEFDTWREKDFSICTQPMEPHVTAGGRVSASGGYWFGVNACELEDTGRTEVKRFWTWGGLPGGGMGVTFTLRVKVWKHYSKKTY